MREIDPATFEVVKNALYCAAEEMKVVLAKTAYSPLLKVAGDYSCGLFDVARRDGRTGTGPAHSSGLDAAGGQGGHPGLARPFDARRRVHSQRSLLRRQPSARRQRRHARRSTRAGCSASPACAPTGRTSAAARPARTAPAPRSTARGCACRPSVSTPPGSLNREVDAIIFTNVRTPDERRGDLRAQMAANHRGVTRLSELARRYGAERLLAIMQEVMDYSERMMRTLLAALPDGTAALRGFLRRRRRAGERRQGGPAVLDPHAGRQAGRPADGGLRRDRRPGGGPDERAAERDRLRDLLRDQDDRRPDRSRPAQLRLLAPHRAARGAGDGGERGGARAGGLRQPRDQPPRVRHAVRRHGQAGPRARDGVLAGDLGDPHARRCRSAYGRTLRFATRRSRAASARGPPRTASPAWPAASRTR